MEKPENWEVHKGLKTQHHSKADRISDLPDHILLRVISYLPTPSAVATCVLSKRWKDIWTGINTLDLSNCSERLKSHQHRISFRNFLDKILSSNDFSYMQHVKFDLSGGIDCVHAIEWVTSLMKRGVKRLELKKIENFLHGNSDGAMPLSAEFYASNELVELRLGGNIHVCFPTSLHFPLLKDVCLFGINFLDGSSVRNLVSRCLILENLSILHCNGEGNIDLLSYSLRVLSISHLCWLQDNVVSISAPNLHELVVMELTCSCVISTPKLRHLFLSNHCKKTYYHVGKMPSLVYASVSIDSTRNKVVEILDRVSGSASLTLAESTIMMLEDNDHGLPVFSNLMRLEVSVSSWHTVVHILELSPNLKHIIADFDTKEKLVWFCPPRVPDCLRVVEEVEIQWFDGDIFVVKMMLYIMITAKSLKRMIVKVSSGCDRLNEESIAVLEMAPRVSSNCDIIVYYY